VQGVRLAGIIELVHVDPEVLFLCATTRDGFRISVWKREVERLGIIAYARDGAPLAPDLGGPFRCSCRVSRTKRATCGTWA
jgi:hypothetical protein